MWNKSLKGDLVNKVTSVWSHLIFNVKARLQNSVTRIICRWAIFKGGQRDQMIDKQLRKKILSLHSGMKTT